MGTTGVVQAIFHASWPRHMKRSLVTKLVKANHHSGSSKPFEDLAPVDETSALLAYCYGNLSAVLYELDRFEVRNINVVCYAPWLYNCTTITSSWHH